MNFFFFFVFTYALTNGLLSFIYYLESYYLPLHRLLSGLRHSISLETLKNRLTLFLSPCLTFWQHVWVGKAVPEWYREESPLVMSVRLRPHGVLGDGKMRFQKSYLYPSLCACNCISRGTKTNWVLRILYRSLFCCRPGLRVNRKWMWKKIWRRFMTVRSGHFVSDWYWFRV